MRAGIFLLLVVGPAAASIPTPWPIHRRLLAAEAVLVARCTPTDDAGLHRVQIVEVLENRSAARHLTGFLLDDTIPCTIIGARAAVPGGDVLLFVNVDPQQKRLRCLYASTNSVVPLGGEVTECLADATRTERIAGAQFLARVRETLAALSDEAFLEQATLAREPPAPFAATDRPALVARLGHLRAVHDGWEPWTPDGKPPSAHLSRRISCDRPSFAWSGARQTQARYGVARTFTLTAGFTLALRWRSRVTSFEIEPAPLFVEVREKGRVLRRCRLPVTGAPSAWDTGVQEWDAGFVTERPREVQIVLAFEDAVGAGEFQSGEVTVERCGEDAGGVERLIPLD